MAPVIDLTVEPRNRLTALPPELLHVIFSYLFTDHEPDRVFIELNIVMRRNVCYERKGEKPWDHVLDRLAAVNRKLRFEINEWALHFLLKHQAITHYRPPKEFQKGVKCNLLRSAKPGLLSWSQRCCVFCGRKSTNSAIFMNGLRCCKPCDKREWPDKMTKTAAKQYADLSDEDLLPPGHLTARCTEMVRTHHKPRYGTYMCNGVPTTMFLKRDVEALAKTLYGPDITFPYKRRLALKQPRYPVLASSVGSLNAEKSVTVQAGNPSTIREWILSA